MKQKKETKIERQRVQIKDVPYVYFDFYEFEGEIKEVSQKILNIRNKVKEAYIRRDEENKKNFHKDKIPVYTPFKDYQHILFGFEFGYDGDRDIEIKVFRDETDEELNNRIEANKNKSIAAKKAAETRKLAQEKREKTLFENLKKKYGE